MADKPAAEKTEQPTPRRLNKAREEGQIPQSQELASALTLVALLAALVGMGPGLLHWCRTRLESGLSTTSPVAAFSDVEAFIHLARGDIVDMLIILLPTLAILAAGSLVAGVAMSGLAFAPAAVRLKWDAISPVRNLERMFNKRSLVRVLVSILKLLFIGVIVWIYLRDQLEALAMLRWAWSSQLITATGRIILGLILRVTIAVLLIGLADAFYQKWQHVQELKMTREEVKQERKDLDGSPEVKGRIRRLQIEMSLKRLRQDVPKASVILVNPTHVAVALRYEAKTMEVPVLVAKGADHMAEKIVKIGRSYGIPIVQRPQIARAIFATVKPGQPIPEGLYMAVAEVLAMIYRLRQKRRN